MPWYRIYVNHEEGNDLARVVDVEADDEAGAHELLTLEAGEVLYATTSLAEDPT